MTIVPITEADANPGELQYFAAQLSGPAAAAGQSRHPLREPMSFPILRAQ